MRPSNRRTIGVIAGLSLALVLGLTFKQKVIPPTPLLYFPAGSDAATGAADTYTGRVTIDSGFKANGGSGITGARVKFEAGARTHWHSHPKGQLLIVTEGQGWVQDEAGTKRELGPGDTVWTAPDVKHWHGATPFGSMTQIAIAEPGLRGTVVDWGDAVTDAVYRALPGAILLDQASVAPASAPSAEPSPAASPAAVPSPAAGRSK